MIDFRFSNGQRHLGRVLANRPAELFSIEYFGGSEAIFTLRQGARGGTDLLLEEYGIPESEWADQRAGWVSLLLALKATVDFGVDLRNDDPEKGWEQGYVDV